jgi:Inner membrane component of T3SS, periplasmic domain
MAHQVSAILLVESGVHQAARAVLAADKNQVGRSADNDIVVTDIGVNGTAFVLEYCGRDVVLHAAGTVVEFPGRKPLAPGETGRCASGGRFTSGGVSFRLEFATHDPGSGVKPARSRFGSHAALAATGVIAAAALIAMVPLKTAPARPADAVETTGSIASASGLAAQSSRQRQQFALESLRKHLAAADLASLTLAAQPDGSIEARGQILKSQESAWRDVGHWFDTIAGGQAVLVDAVTVTTEPQPLSVQAVWPGQDPYVIDASGEKLFVGAALPSGWTISSIDRSHVLVKRGDEVLSVRF